MNAAVTPIANKTRRVWTMSASQTLCVTVAKCTLATWRRIANASVRMSAAVIATVLAMKFALTIQTVRLDVASIVIATTSVPMAKSAAAAQANAFL